MEVFVEMVNRWYFSSLTWSLRISFVKFSSKKLTSWDSKSWWKQVSLAVHGLLHFVDFHTYFGLVPFWWKALRKLLFGTWLFKITAFLWEPLVYQRFELSEVGNQYGRLWRPLCSEVWTTPGFLTSEFSQADGGVGGLAGLLLTDPPTPSLPPPSVCSCEASVTPTWQDLWLLSSVHKRCIFLFR